MQKHKNTKHVKKNNLEFGLCYSTCILYLSPSDYTVQTLELKLKVRSLDIDILDLPSSLSQFKIKCSACGAMEGFRKDVEF